MRAAAYLLAGMLFIPTTVLADIPIDPLKSSQWTSMYHLFLKEHPIQFDPRIQLFTPKSAEDSMHVPVAFQITELQGIKQILVFADFNPLPKVLEYLPAQDTVFLGFRLKIQQASPIRVAALMADGWHVNGAWIDAAGGGCTVPSVASGSQSWADKLGQVTAHIWQSPSTPQQRLRFQVMHPMDTGLAKGIPVFHIEELVLTTPEGKALGVLKPAEPISENPVFTIDLPLDAQSHTVHLEGVDNNGNQIVADIAE